MMNAVAELTPREYYRLPWTLTDNAISWLEVTDDCNLDCEGCYRPHIKNHKSLELIAEELAVFKARRKSDCMSLAGGDPLVHPQIVEIVKMVKEAGWKPIINTNGLALGKKLLKKLKDAGAYGFTFHIDTTQLRADSKARRACSSFFWLNNAMPYMMLAVSLRLRPPKLKPLLAASEASDHFSRLM